MYKAFYNLKGEPFGKTLKPSELFICSQTKEADARLEYMKNARGIMLFTGKPGTGKTTCLRRFTQGLNPSHHRVIYIPLSSVTPTEFYRQLNYGLGGKFFYRKSDIFVSIQTLINDMAVNSNITAVIIFDDAHFFKAENFNELQMLLNFRMDSYDPALVILCGQPMLNEKISMPVFCGIEQRIGMKFTLGGLNEQETKEYILHHLKLKGRKNDLFNDNAISSIFKLSSGVKRVINKICLKALMYGVMNKSEIINEEIIYQASKEL